MKKVILSSLLPYISMIGFYLVAIAIDIRDIEIRSVDFLQFYLVVIVTSYIVSIILFVLNKNIMIRSKKLSLIFLVLFIIGVLISTFLYIFFMSLSSGTIPIG